MSTITRPLRLLSVDDITTREQGIAVADGKMVGRIETVANGRSYATPLGTSQGAYCLTREEALSHLVGYANKRKIRSALTAAGYKAPAKGSSAGFDVDVMAHGKVIIDYVTRGFGSIMSGGTRQRRLDAVADYLASRGVPVHRVEAQPDRYGTHARIEIG